MSLTQRWFSLPYWSQKACLPAAIDIEKQSKAIYSPAGKWSSPLENRTKSLTGRNLHTPQQNSSAESSSRGGLLYSFPESAALPIKRQLSVRQEDPPLLHIAHSLLRRLLPEKKKGSPVEGGNGVVRGWSGQVAAGVRAEMASMTGEGGPGREGTVLWACETQEGMVLIKEFRVVLPCSVEEYQVGQLFSVAEASKNNTGGGEGIEVLKNEPYQHEGEQGQYTHKIYHLQSKVPGFIKMFAPEGSLVVHERAWNAYPYCRTVITNEYMKDDFFVKIETWHKPDLGEQENVHGLDADTWKDVEVVHIDIGDRTHVSDDDYKPDEDPALFKSLKTGRGPLGPDWKRELANNEDCPYMCAYKLVTVKFRWWGLQGRVEKFIQKQERRLFTNFHRQLFCWLDKWVDLSMADIRRMEDKTQKELDEIRQKGTVRGMTVGDE